MGSTKVEAPQTPQAPSTAEGVRAWAESLPQVFAEQQRQAPLEAQQQLELLQQYGEPMGRAALEAQRALYPSEYAISDLMQEQIQEGMGGEPPDWYMDKYEDYTKSLLGENIASPMGAGDFARGMLEQQKGWGDYYRNLGLSFTNRQPVYQPQQPQTSNYAAGFTPGAVAGQMGTNYGNYMGGYSSMYGQNAQLAAQGDPMMNALAGAGGMALGSWMGNPFGSFGMGGKQWGRG